MTMPERVHLSEGSLVRSLVSHPTKKKQKSQKSETGGIHLLTCCLKILQKNTKKKLYLFIDSSFLWR